MSADPWGPWREARPGARVVHLDSASAGRSSYAVIEAVVQHLHLEAEVGGYAAAEQAADGLTRAREDVGRLLGLDAEGVAFTESATAALEALVAAWPLHDGARVGVPPASWGPNVELLRRHGLAPVALDVDGVGVLHPELLEQRLAADPLDALLVDRVAAHRGLAQPVRALAVVARRHGVPLWVDAAQALGHVACDDGADGADGADAVVATSRKWLAGPRGVGVLGVAAPWRDRLRVPPRAKRPDAGKVALLESEEAHVAGRLGMGVAAAELLAAGADRVHDRLAEVGRLVRERVADVVGWEVVAPEAPAGAITAVAATAGQDVAATRAALLREGVLTTHSLPWRSPGETAATARETLRVSPHVDVVDADLDALVDGLARAR